MKGVVLLLMREFLARYYVTASRARKWLMRYQVRPVVLIVWGVLRKTPGVRTLLFARQSGKTEVLGVGIAVAAMIVNFLCLLETALNLGTYWRDRFPEGLRVVGFAPSNATQAKQVLARARMIYMPWLNFWAARDKRLDVVTSSVEQFEAGYETERGVVQTWLRITVRTAGEQGRGIEGATADLLFVEEMQDVDIDVFDFKIRPSVTATGAPIVAVGTSTPEMDALYTLVQRNLSRRPEHHVRVTVADVVASGFREGNYEREYAETVADLGEQHPSVRAKYWCEWLLTEGMLITERDWPRVLIPEGALPWLVRARSVAELAELELPRGCSWAAGLDIAKTIDATVLKIAIADHRHREQREAALNALLGRGESPDEERVRLPELYEVFSLSWRGRDYREQARAISRTLQPLKGKLVVAVDNTGERGGMAERLEEAGYGVLPVEFTGGVNTGKGKLCTDFDQLLQGGWYHVVVDERWTGASMWAQVTGGEGGGRVTAMDGEREYRDHRHQFTHARREFRQNRLNIEARQEGDHDDHVDASMLLVPSALAGAGLPVSVWLQSRGERRASAGLIEEAELERASSPAPAVGERAGEADWMDWNVW